MVSATSSAPVSKKMFWAGWIVSVLPVFMLLFSAYGKLTTMEAVRKGFPEMGWDLDLLLPLGVVEVGCTLLYLIPQTCVLGAILLTGYLGGAVATHLRLHQPACIFPIVMGVLVWLGLYLRYSRVRALFPIRS
jgi:hypothetical protein